MGNQDPCEAVPSKTGSNSLVFSGKAWPECLLRQGSL